MSSGTGCHQNSGTLPPMQYPSSNSEMASGVNMGMYALHERNENMNEYENPKSGTIKRLAYMM